MDAGRGAGDGRRGAAGDAEPGALGLAVAFPDPSHLWSEQEKADGTGSISGQAGDSPREACTRRLNTLASRIGPPPSRIGGAPPKCASGPGPAVRLETSLTTQPVARLCFRPGPYRTTGVALLGRDSNAG